MKPQLPFDAYRIEGAENASPVAWQSGSAHGWMRTVTEGVLLVFTWSSLLPSAAYAADRWQAQRDEAPPITPLAAMAAARSHPPISEETLLKLAGLDAQTLAALDAAVPAAPVAVPATQRLPAKTTGSFTPRYVVPANSARPPHLTTAAFHAAGFTAAGISAKLTPAGFTAPPPPTAADLAETPDTRLTPELRQLATETLNRSPVAIYQWVRNNIAFVPTYGALQGADRTRQTGAGNAFDTASLLVALYRAAGISARYAYGTIELPVARAQRWLGGVPTPQAAVDLLAQGGIPSTPVTSNGQITSIRLEHVWVEAWVDDVSRGATQRTPNTWLPVDPSFKDLRVTPGRDLTATTPVDATTLSGQLQTGATLTPDSVRNLNTSTLNPALTNWQTNAQAGLDPQATVGSVLGQTDILPENLPLLVGALPYKAIAFADRYSALPDTWRWQVRYGLYATDHDRAQRVAIAEARQNLADLAGGSLALSFVPLTAADAANWQTLAASTTRPLPAQPIHLQARLSKATGAATTLLTSGGDLTFGTTVRGGVSIFDPRDKQWHDAPSHPVVAGETHVLATAPTHLTSTDLNAARDRLQTWRDRLSGTSAGDLTALPADLLAATAQVYLATLDGDARLLAAAYQVRSAPLPLLARAQTLAVPSLGTGGAVETVSFPGLALVAERISRSGVGAGTRGAAYQQSLAQRASLYAQLVLDRLFGDTNRPAASAARALTTAHTQGQTLYLANAGNLATVLPQLALDPATRDLLSQSAAAGRSALVHASPLSFGGWTGTGYALQDLASGAADYEITQRRTAALQGIDWTDLALANPASTAARVGAIASLPLQQYANLAPGTSALLADYRGLRWTDFAGANLWTQASFQTGAQLPSLSLPAQQLAQLTLNQLSTRLPGVTTNHPPQFTSTPLARAAVGQPYRAQVTATDPDGDAVTLTLQSGPVGMGLSAGSLVWNAPTVGAHQVVLQASDGQLTAEQRFTLTVGEDLPLDLQVAFSPRFVNAGDPIVITVAASGGKGQLTRSLTVDGSQVPLDANGQATLRPTQVGGHAVTATVTDASTRKTVQSAFGVRDANDTTAPAVKLVAPADEGDVTQQTPVTGQVEDSRLVEWILAVRPSQMGATPGPWQVLARGTQNIPGPAGMIARFDPTVLDNGWYTLQLTAVDANGLESSDTHHVEVWGDRKIGIFEVSFADVQVEASGLPLQVTRTYDTRRKQEALDFGMGWSVDYQSIRVRKNVPFGQDWRITTNTQALEHCLRPVGKRAVSFVLPDGSMHRFTARNEPECRGLEPPMVNPVFSPADERTTSQLEVRSVDGILARGGHLFDTNVARPWNALSYKLTTRDGYVYFIKEEYDVPGTIIERIQDPSGNTLDFGKNGILHSNGQSILFQRDGFGRITTVTDPAGGVLKYSYNANGDLTSVTNRAGQASRHTYDDNHYLTGFTDPRGVLVLKNEYDEQGRLIRQTDAAGNVTDYSLRQPDQNQEVVKDRRGNLTTYTYDAQGNVVAIRDALGNTTTFTYDANGYETSATDPLGNTVRRTVNGKGDVLTETDPAGQTTTFTYTGHGDLTGLTDPKGNRSTVTYNGNRLPNGATDPLGNTVTMATDGRGNLLYGIDPAGNKISFEYDTLGRKIKETNAAGQVTEYTLDANGRATAITRRFDGQVAVTQRTYDAEGRITSETDPLGNVTRTQYNAAGQPVQVTDALGRITKHTYDARGHLIRTDYPDGTFQASELDANGNVVAETDPAGRISRTAYDALDRTQSATSADGQVASYTYDAASRLTQTQLPGPAGPVTTRREYDAKGRVTKSIDALGQAVSNVYDSNDNLLQTTNAKGQSVQFQYDANDRLTKTTLPDGSSATFQYDPNGRKIAETDGAGRVTRYGYNALGQLVTVTDPLNQVTTYGYDQAGRKISQTDANGHTTRWQYDLLDRIVRRTLPDGKFETFEYDAVGRTMAHTNFQGQTTRYTYDSADRVQSRTDVDGQATYSYTASGQVQTLDDARGRTRYTYDVADRLLSKTEPDGTRLSYAYDPAGNRQQLTIEAPNQPAKTIKYQYDANSRLIAVTDWNNQTTRYDYDANGNRTQVTRPNGVVTTYGYDTLDRVNEIKHLKGTTVLHQVRYTYNAANQRTERHEEGASLAPRSEQYGYDAAGRLTSASSAATPSFSEQWKWDAAGNRTERTRTTQSGTQTSQTLFGLNDQLLSQTGADPVTWQYDGNGRLTQESRPGESWGYAWDSRDRLIQAVRNPGQPTAETIRYRYDDQGNRIEKSVGANPAPEQRRRYTIDGNRGYAQVLEERDGNGQLLAHFVHGDDSLEHLVAFYRNQGGNLKAYYPLTDALGSVLAVTDDQGAIVDRYRYLPNGASLGIYDAGGDLRLDNKPQVENPYRFAGEWQDETTGLVYLRARWLNLNDGRFLSLDPASGNDANPVSLNKYLYGNGDPVNIVDPSGEIGMASVMKAIGAVAILASLAMIVRDLRNGNYMDAFIGGILLLFGGLFFRAGWAILQLIGRGLGYLGRGIGTIGSRLVGRSKPQTVSQPRGPASRKPTKCFGRCFAAGTLVATPEGLRPIEELKPGDRVWSKLEEGTRQPFVSEVLATHVRADQPIYEVVLHGVDGETSMVDTLLATPNHPFFVYGKGFVNVIDLMSGDLVASYEEGVNLRVHSVNLVSKRGVTYNLTVNSGHTFYVGPVRAWVHNTRDDCDVDYSSNIVNPLKVKVGPKWQVRDITNIQCSRGCDKVAGQIQKMIGGAIVTIKPVTTSFRNLGGVYSAKLGRFKNVDWEDHYVVVKDGRVYDLLTGYRGLPINEYKALWQWPEVLVFGF